jgi:hypothetical protein
VYASPSILTTPAAAGRSLFAICHWPPSRLWQTGRLQDNTLVAPAPSRGATKPCWGTRSGRRDWAGQRRRLTRRR